MQESVLKLKALGQMPSDYQDVADDLLEKYGCLIKEIETPIDMDDAKLLVDIFPEFGLFGLEWTLLHIFETVIESKSFDSLTYHAIIAQCPSEEWREALSKRYETYKSK